MSLQTRLAALVTAIKTETKSIRTFISGSSSGDVSALTTTATNLVAAVNEVKSTADAASAAAVSIDDVTASTTSVYSSAKVDSQITSEVAAALEGEDLSDLAAAVAANAAADMNLTTVAQFNTLSATVNAKANVSETYSQVELGDPETDLVALWDSA